MNFFLFLIIILVLLFKLFLQKLMRKQLTAKVYYRYNAFKLFKCARTYVLTMGRKNVESEFLEACRQWDFTLTMQYANFTML